MLINILSLEAPSSQPFFYIMPASIPFAYAFSELLKLSREYQTLTVTKVADFRWTRSRIALQVNRAESLPFVSIRVASLL